MTETGGQNPHAFLENPLQIAAPQCHTFPTRDASGLGDVAHPGRSHDHESAAAPVYTLVDGVSGWNSLVLTPSAPPGLIIPENGATPSGYLWPDLLGSITP